MSKNQSEMKRPKSNDEKTVLQELTGLIIKEPKNYEEYEIQFMKFNDRLHKSLIDAFPQFKPEDLNPTKIATYIPQ